MCDCGLHRSFCLVHKIGIGLISLTCDYGLFCSIQKCGLMGQVALLVSLYRTDVTDELPHTHLNTPLVLAILMVLEMTHSSM